MGYLHRFYSLKRLFLMGCGITGEGLREPNFDKLQQLETLNLGKKKPMQVTTASERAFAICRVSRKSRPSRTCTCSAVPWLPKGWPHSNTATSRLSSSSTSVTLYRCRLQFFPSTWFPQQLDSSERTIPRELQFERAFDWRTSPPEVGEVSRPGLR